MQSASDLVKIRDSIISRTLRLRQILSSVSYPLGAEDRRAIAFVTIELDNMIVVGLRQYTKSSLLGGRTSSGARVTATVKPTSTEEAAAYIFRALNPTGYARQRNPQTILEKDEVGFRDPKNIEKVFIAYSASNLPNLAIALSLNAEVFSEAKICRHFFAHRAKNTYEAVRGFSATLGVVGFESPENLVLQGRPGTGVRLMDGWLSDVENFFDLAT